MNAKTINLHLASLSPESRADIAAGNWDEVMTDALYAAVGAETPEDMQEARSISKNLCLGLQEYRVTDEATCDTYWAASPENAVEQFLDSGYDTGDMTEGAKWDGLVQIMDEGQPVLVAAYAAKADGNGGVKSYTVQTY